MKVGLIGLGRMGEGMSRRMMKAGIEVWGYRRNYAKANEAFEKGYVDGIATTIENLVKVVKKNKNGRPQPGVFQMVVPAETVEETINELLRYCSEGDIIIDHGNSNFKDSRKRAERLAKLGIQYIDCGTSGGVYGLDRGYCLMVGGGDTAVATCKSIFDFKDCFLNSLWILIIAILIISAALPCIGALSAIRSAISRRIRLSLVKSGR